MFISIIFIVGINISLCELFALFSLIHKLEICYQFFMYFFYVHLVILTHFESTFYMYSNFRFIFFLIKNEKLLHFNRDCYNVRIYSVPGIAKLIT